MKTADPSMEALAETMGQIAAAFEGFKNKQDEEIRQIRNHAERLETKLCRPGAFVSGERRGPSGFQRARARLPR